MVFSSHLFLFYFLPLVLVVYYVASGGRPVVKSQPDGLTHGCTWPDSYSTFGRWVREREEAPSKRPATGWNRTNAFRSACLPPYDDSYFVEGMMMYDTQHLYIAAHVGDPEPMRNVAHDTMEFAGGSVIVRVSTDRKLGWPLKARQRMPIPKNPGTHRCRIRSAIVW